MGIWAAAGDLLGAPGCAGCGAPLGPLCAGCAGSLAAATSSATVPPAATVVAPWAYEGLARELLLRLKLGASRVAADPLVDALHDALARSGVRAQVVTWVPGRRRDERRRGYDHARVLACGLARSLGLPAAGLLRRVGGLRHQASLTAAQRRHNQAGAFSARCSGGAVLLVDDVVTTGATVSACAEALLAAGAERVDVAVACRA